MKKIYIALQVVVFCSMGYGQVKLNQLSDFFTAIYDINNEGKGVHGNGYYDFATNTTTATEEEVAQTVAITNSEQVLGLVDGGADNYIPGTRLNGTWSAFPASAFDPNKNYTIYDISQNGMYVVGQTEWTPEDGAWGFIYNTQTQTYKLLSSTLYEYGAAYAVNNNGIAVGWVDDLEPGTLRMPAYFKEDGTVTLINNVYGEANGINENNEIVGYTEDSPFIYKINGAELTTYSVPEGYEMASFSDISDNGAAVGYGETYIEGQGFLRMPIIFHNNLGTDIKPLTEVLSEQGIDTSNLDGQIYRISSNGKYLCGWTSGPAFTSMGWAVYLDNLLLAAQDVNSEKIALYPNPVKDILTITGTKADRVEIYNFVGQKVISAKVNNGKIDVSALAKGAYILKVNADGKAQTLKFIKE